MLGIGIRLSGICLIITALIFTSTPSVIADNNFAARNERRYYGTGKIVQLSPFSSEITIEHGTIKGFAAQGQSQFLTTTPKLLSGLAANDLIAFEIKDHKGDARIDKIKKTGYEAPASDKLPLGKAVSEVLQGAGSATKVITEPLAPASEPIAQTIDATTAVVSDAGQSVDEVSTTKF